MTDRDGWVAAIAARPADDVRRLAFADWLDEHGDAPRAAFVRAQVGAARLPPGHPRRRDLLRTADDLEAAHDREWLGPWFDRLYRWEFRRGFLHTVRIAASDWLAHADDLFRREPVYRVEFAGDDGGIGAAGQVRPVVTHPAFAHVRDCAVGGLGKDLSAWMRALAEAAHVTRLRRLNPPPFPPNAVDDAALAAFCGAAHLWSLTSLDLTGCGGQAEGQPPDFVRAVAESTFAGRLRRLRLAACRVGPDGFRRVADDRVFGRLRALDLSGNNPPIGSWTAVFFSGVLSRIHDFRVDGDELPGYALSPLAGRVSRLHVWLAIYKFQN